MSDVQSTVQYREVPGFLGYRVGDDGSVWTRWARCWQGRKLSDEWKPMKLSVNDTGYFRVNLVQPEGGTYRTFRVHALVLMAFVGPRQDGMQCRHLDGIRANNNLSNLAWGTVQENAEDRCVHTNYGPNSTLYEHNGVTQPLRRWAKKFGIPYNCLWHRINTLGMSFSEATSRPFNSTDSNGGHWKKAKASRR